MPVSCEIIFFKFENGAVINTHSHNRDPAIAEVVADFGQAIGHAMSWPPMAGRVFATLMLHGGELTLPELGSLMSASPGSISQSTRLLLDSCVIERLKVPGTRHHAYRYREDAWLGCFQHQVDLHVELLELATRSESSVKSLDGPANERVQQMSTYYTFMTTHLTKLAAMFVQGR